MRIVEKPIDILTQKGNANEEWDQIYQGLHWRMESEKEMADRLLEEGTKIRESYAALINPTPEETVEYSNARHKNIERLNLLLTSKSLLEETEA